MERHDWDARVGHLEREGLELVGVVTTAATWTAQLAGRAGRILDVGCGPGVGTCELARRFPDAHVVAVDASAAMLDRVRSDRVIVVGRPDRGGPRVP